MLGLLVKRFHVSSCMVTAGRYMRARIHNGKQSKSVQLWRESSKDIDWIKAPAITLDDSATPFNKWFPDGTLNTCFNCLDRHVNGGHGDWTALIYDSPVTETIKKISYAELLNNVQAFAGVLKGFGVNRGDVVVIYMPMIPEAVVAMLACARIGAVHSVVFGGFAAKELAVRIQDSKSKLVITASCGIDGKKTIQYKPLVDDAIALASSSEHEVKHCIVLQRPSCEAVLVPGRDIDWVAAHTKGFLPFVGCEELASTDPLYVLYTSGTTSSPKGIVRDNGGHAVALMWAMYNVFGMKEKDVFWAASDIGWVVGHTCSVYGPLLRGCTSVIYEGKPVGTPDAGAFWRVIGQHKVNALFCAPTAFRAIKLQDNAGELPRLYDLSSLRHLFLAGERSDSGTIKWAKNTLNVPVLDNWWQTETGWPICSSMVGAEGYMRMKMGSCFKPCSGWDLKVLRMHSGDHEESFVEELTDPGVVGALAVKLPLPPGFMTSLYKNDARFLSAYMTEYPGYYNTGDIGYIDDDGYVFVTSRAEDEIKISGHRISTGAMEEVISQHPDVCEVAVVGIKDSLKGQVPVGLIILHQHVVHHRHHHERIETELIALIREKIGPVAVFKKALFVTKLPKTRSGKILRGVMRKIADKEPYNVPATIDDHSVLEDIEQVLSDLQYLSANERNSLGDQNKNDRHS